MIVSFLHVGEDTTLPKIMCRSVRKWMPEATLLHMTDRSTPRIDGCLRQEMPYDGERLMTYRLRHLAVPKKPMIVLDTDVVVQADLEPVFDQKFDVALTKRHGRIMYNGTDIVPLMPWNTGVMFSKSRAFWRECAESCAKAPEKIQQWWGDQVSVKLAVDSCRYKVLELPVEKFNYTPATESEDVSARYVVHYKGPRKQWMINRVA